MKILIIAMTLLSTIFGAKAQEARSVKILAPKEFKQAVSEKTVQLVDVRTSEEFNQGSINHAVNINFFQKDLFVDEFNKLKKEEPLYIYCGSGNRSKQASKILDSLGFKTIYDLKDGYRNWPYKN